MRLARSLSRLGTETAFEVLAQARKLEALGKDIIHLEIGEPDFPTPANVVARAQKALDEGWTHYGPPAGLLEARAAVAEHVFRTRGARVDPEEVIIAPGAKPLISFAIMALADPKDEVIYPNPGWPIYESVANFIGAKAVPLPLREENGFAVDPAELKKRLTPRTRVLILNSPSNPTGGVMPFETLEEIARLLAKHPRVAVISDEIYSGIIYEGRHHSPLSLRALRPRTVLVDGLSKSHAMTGWRLGYGAAPKPLVEAMAKLANNVYSCAASFTQIAAIEALTGPRDEPAKMVAEFRSRREAMLSGLSKLPGFSCRRPAAAFYAFPNIRATKMNSRELAQFFLDKAGVACLSGTAFGKFGEGYLRFSYANSTNNINKAIERMGRALAELH